MSKTSIFSFFAGAGFLDLGFEKTGCFETVFVNEYHKAFMDIYKGSRIKLGIPEPKYGYDIKDVTQYNEPEEFNKLNGHLSKSRENNEIIGFIGGPPCPDFSVGGKNKGHQGENGKLSGTYIDLICKTTPDFFLFENVKGLYRTAKHREFFESLKVKLRKKGYFLTENMINALDFGAPQDRQRIILVGFHRNFLKDYVSNNFEKAVGKFNWLKNTNYLSSDLFLNNWPTQDPFIEDGFRTAPEDIVSELTVEHWFKQNEVESHPNANHYFTPRAALSKFQSIPEGDDLKKSFKRLHRHRYSPTAAYGNNEVHLHPYKARRISVAEALAIQSLPKEFIIPSNISLSDMFKTIGNGVPYLAAKGLALTIADFISYLQTLKSLKKNAKINSF